MKFRVVVASLAATGLLTACASGIEHVPAVGDSSAQAVDAGHQQPDQPAITRWYYAVAPKISDVEQSITWAQWAARRPRHRGLARACRQIRHDARVAQRARPAPDRFVRHRVARELRDFDRAAGLCLAGRLDDANDAVNAGHHWAYLADRRTLHLVHAAG